MQKVEKTLVCDVCEAEGPGVRKQTLKVNQKAAEGEVCEECWSTQPIPALLAAFRRPGTAPRRIEMATAR